MLLTNYSDVNYIFNLEFEDFKELVDQMIRSEKEKREKELDDKLYFRWVHEMPYLEEQLNFKEYKEVLFNQPKAKSKEVVEQENIELIKRTEAIRKKHQGEAGE